MSIFGRKDNVITYTVNKAINRDMYITVQNGEVVVNAPWYFTTNKIQEIVQSKKNWILSKMQEYEQKVLPNIQSVKIFGRNYDIKVLYKNIKNTELNLKENSIIEKILLNKYKKIGNEKILQTSIEKMYEQIANDKIDEIMEKIRVKLGIAPEDYKIEKMNNILGQCTEMKTIKINPELMKYKMEIIEYVITHEFCHLKYKTHGKRFYEMLEKNIPEYEKYEKELEKYQY